MRKILSLLLSLQFMAAPLLAFPGDDEERAASVHAGGGAGGGCAGGDSFHVPDFDFEEYMHHWYGKMDDATRDRMHEILLHHKSKEEQVNKLVDIPRKFVRNLGCKACLWEGIDDETMRFLQFMGINFKEALFGASVDYAYIIVDAASPIASFIEEAYKVISTPPLLSLSARMTHPEDPPHIRAAKLAIYGDYGLMLSPGYHGKPEDVSDDEDDASVDSEPHPLEADALAAIRAHFKEAEKLEKYVPWSAWDMGQEYPEDTVMVVDERELPAHAGRINAVLAATPHPLLVDLYGDRDYTAKTSRFIDLRMEYWSKRGVISRVTQRLTKKQGDAFLFKTDLPAAARDIIVTNTAGDITQTAPGFLYDTQLDRVRMVGFENLRVFNAKRVKFKRYAGVDIVDARKVNAPLSPEATGKIEFGYLPALTQIEDMFFEGIHGLSRDVLNLQRLIHLERVHRIDPTWRKVVLPFRVIENQLPVGFLAKSESRELDLRSFEQANKIEAGALSGMQHLEALHLPATPHLSYFGPDVLADCPRLKWIDLKVAPHLRILRKGAFRGTQAQAIIWPQDVRNLIIERPILEGAAPTVKHYLPDGTEITDFAAQLEEAYKNFAAVFPDPSSSDETDVESGDEDE